MIDCLTIWSSKTKAFRNPFKKTFKTAVCKLSFVSAPDSEILEKYGFQSFCSFNAMRKICINLLDVTMAGIRVRSSAVVQIESANLTSTADVVDGLKNSSPIKCLFRSKISERKENNH